MARMGPRGAKMQMGGPALGLPLAFMPARLSVVDQPQRQRPFRF